MVKEKEIDCEHKYHKRKINIYRDNYVVVKYTYVCSVCNKKLFRYSYGSIEEL